MQPKRLGPYELGEVIGKGGMGSVYEAVDTQSGQRVAIKALSPQLAQADGFRERFESEIESLKTLRHEGIVRLYGYGAQDGVLFYSMELVEGTSLEEELRARRRFNWREVAHIAIQLCRSLKHAHDHGVVHRDIKPANILVDGENRVKLADFGIARLFGSTQLTSAGGVLGTADYMSPEQAEGRPVTDRCDQYSLGGVMYALLAGRPPFRAKSLPEMLQLQRFAEPEPLRRYAVDTPEQMEQVVNQLLAKNPQDRFPNTVVLARHLEAMVRALSRPAADDFALDDGGPRSGAIPQGGLAERHDASLAMTRALDDLDIDPGGGTLRPGHAATEVSAGGARRSRSPVDDDSPDAITPPAPNTPLPGELADGPVRQETSFTTVEEDARQRLAAERTGWRSAALQAMGMVTLLAGVIGMFVFLSRPESADSLYITIRAAATASDPNGLRNVDNEIAEFVRRFPEDPRVDEVGAIRQQLELDRLERKLQNRSRAVGRDDEPLLAIERHYLQAEEVARRDPLEARRALEAIVALYGGPPPKTLAADDAARRAACLRLARKRLGEIQSASDEFASRAGPELVERLQAADELASDDPQSARRIYQAIVDLYKDHDWAADQVRHAQEQLDQLEP